MDTTGPANRGFLGHAFEAIQQAVSGKNKANPADCGLLALCYLCGIGCPQDEKLAGEMAALSTFIPNPAGLFVRGVMHHEGIGGYEQNYDKALELFGEAANNGSAPAKTWLHTTRRYGIRL